MSLAQNVAEGAAKALASNDQSAALSMLQYLVDLRGEEDTASTIIDLVGFLSAPPSAEISTFFVEIDELLANSLDDAVGYQGQGRTEAVQHRTVTNFQLMGCPRCEEIAMERVATCWQGLQHFQHLRTVFGFTPSDRFIRQFALRAVHWRATGSDFEAVLGYYLLNDEVTECPFKSFSVEREAPLIAILNTLHAQDDLPIDKIRHVLGLCRKHYPPPVWDDFNFITMLIDTKGLDKMVALSLTEMRDDVLINDLGL
jgi:hypothetical protein